MGRTPLAVFCDMLPVHKSLICKAEALRLDIRIIFNVSYSPQFNPIEAVFSKVKIVFNRRRLNSLVNKQGWNMDEEVRYAFRQITVEHCASCVRKSFHLLDRSAKG